MLSSQLWPRWHPLKSLGTPSRAVRLSPRSNADGAFLSFILYGNDDQLYCVKASLVQRFESSLTNYPLETKSDPLNLQARATGSQVFLMSTLGLRTSKPTKGRSTPAATTVDVIQVIRVQLRTIGLHFPRSNTKRNPRSKRKSIEENQWPGASHPPGFNCNGREDLVDA